MVFSFLRRRRDRLARQIMRNMTELEKAAEAGAWEKAAIFAACQDPLLARYAASDGASEEHLRAFLEAHGQIRSVTDEEYVDWISGELLKRGLLWT